VQTHAADLVSFGSAWRYEQSGTNLGTAWKDAEYNDSAWPQGPGLLGLETSQPYPYPEPIRTDLTVGTNKITYYFRTHFNFPADAVGFALVASNYVDDGAVFYLNGTEVGRIRMPAGVINNQTLATNASPEGQVVVLTFSSGTLVQGDNVLAVEVHQASATSSDFVFGMSLSAIINDCLLPPGTSFPGAGNVGRIADDGTGSNCVVHLTDANQGNAFGVFSIPMPPYITNSLHMHWRSLVGGDTNAVCTGGADGYSMSWGSDLPNPPSYGNPGEEGAGSGLIVTVDTFDNGGGEAPGLEIKWQGALVAFDNINPDPGLAKDFLRKGVFVEADLTVDTAGQATFTYDGHVLTATLLDWSGIPGGGCIMFGARTGGACDNHWIDDLFIEKFSPVRPFILQPPRSQSLSCGGTATFNVIATGTDPLSYQWRYSGADLPGGTQPTLSIGPAGPADAGPYSVRISNSAGSVTSAPVTLTVLTGAVARLSIALVNSNVLIRWPVTCADYDLLETPTLGSPSNWIPATASVDLVGTDYVAIAPLQSAGNRFFRLIERPAGAIPLQPPTLPQLEFSDSDILPIGATGITAVAWREIPGALTDELATQIRFAAQQNSLVQSWLGDRYAYIDTSPLEMPKDTTNMFPSQPLQSRVTFFSHSFNWAVLADMNGTAVVGVTNSTTLQPRAGADEVAAALDLARADPRLAGIVPGLIGRGLLAIIDTPGQPGFGNRVIYVAFSGPDEAWSRHAALVDLTLQQVISVSTP
jgi:hypothetical protein